MLKRIFLGSAMVLTLSMVASAAPIACDTVTLLSQLIAAGSVGCSHQDKLFNNFSYTGDSVSSIQATHQFTASGSGTQDVHGWLFQLPGDWRTTFTLSYDISILTGFPTQRIFQVKDQMNSGSVPNGTGITDTETTIPAGASPYIISLSGAATATETQQRAYTVLATSVHTSSVFTPGSFNGQTGQLASYEQDFFETGTVPEPATFVLMGLGLLGVAAFRRRRVKQQ